MLFDGEEEPREEDNADFYATALRGSKAYVAAHADVHLADGPPGLHRQPGAAAAAGGDERPRDSGRRCAAAARAVGVARVFPGGEGTPVLDDHTPFLRAGIPAIDLIDFTYR